jgi:putative CocE/NonD family hydrolase
MTFHNKCLRLWTFAGLITALFLFGFLTIAGGRAPQAATQKAAGKKPEARPAPLSNFADEGVFLIYVNEDPVVEIQYKWDKGGKYSGTNTVKMAGQSFTTTVDIETDVNGLWTKIVNKAPQGTADIVREGTIAKRTIKEKTETIEVKNGALIFENYSPVFMSMAPRAYDEKKGGKQTFPVFVIPGAAMDEVLEFIGTEERSVAGKDIKLKKYIYSIGGADITIWVDDLDRLYLAEVPVQKAAYVRKGYESLMKKAAEDPLLSAPKYDILQEANVSVRMRDKIKLAINIYRPKAKGKFPVILVRTPYQKEMAELQARAFARRGYACAVQDCRGRFGSEGIWEPFINEPRDGYDTVEWLAGQPWSNGKVGMIGGSYVGWVQWWAARERPPHLVTIIPNVSPPDPFFNIPYEYGVFFILGGIWWADILESNATADLSGTAMSKIGEKKYGKLLQTLPVIDLDEKILGKKNPYWRKWIEHSANDAYWEQANFLDHLKDVNIPVFHQSGWFDGDGIGTKLNYLKMKSFGHPNQKLVVGPWGHTDTASRKIGDLDFGPQALVDLQRDYLRWFDFWLKGIDNRIMKEPLVKVFAMGSNKWLEDSVYPLSYTQFQKWYLTSGGKANTSKGDGLLSPNVPAKDVPHDAYVYNPGDPTPNPDFYERSEEDEKKVRAQEDLKKEVEANHEKVTQARQDILVYQTKPLEKPLTFAGPLSAVLYASSSARDTDWFMRLVWIQKNSKTFPLAEGKIRARFRKSMKKPELLEPGTIYEYALDLWHTGITIPVGDSLRVEVASASFPYFSRNLNTGGQNEKETKFVSAEQMIYHSPAYPSHILLPVIPDEKLK